MRLRKNMFYSVVLLVCYGMLFVSPQELGNTCQPAQFRCHHSGKCIDRYLVRNGNDKNCGKNDTSDEEQPLPRCHPQTEFRCRFNGQCIARKLINRGFFLCSDQSDDGGIPGFPCSRDAEIRCADNWCLPRSQAQYQIGSCLKDESDVKKKLLECSPDLHFACSDGRCIDRNKVGDKNKHCKDGEDERTLLTCSEEEYRCDDGRCILRHQVHDGIPDCISDEVNSTVIGCKDDREFTCHHTDADNNIITRCIPRDWVNDGMLHCKDGSDETKSTMGCNKNEWSCDEGTKCLSKSRLCDGIPDCMDCSDETNLTICSESEAARFFKCVKPMGLGEDFGNKGVLHSHCVLRSYFCDGIADCKDGSDDTEVGSGFKCRVTKLSKGRLGGGTRICILPNNMINDGISDCDDSSDENDKHRSNVYFPCASFFENRDENMIKRSQVCDGIFDCPNLTDECLCDVDVGRDQKKIYSVCNNVCYGLKMARNTTRKIKKPFSASCEICKPGEVMCDSGSDLYTSKCITRLSICDGVVDCKDRMDEVFCTVDETSSSNLNAKIEFNNTYACPLDDMLRHFRPIYPEIVLEHARRCDGVPECVGMADECDEVSDDEMLTSCKHYKSKPQYCAHFSGNNWKNFLNLSKPLKPRSVCDGLVDLKDGQDEMYCSDSRFSCKSISSHDGEEIVNIDQKRVCDGHVDCQDQSDERNCPNHFYCLNSSDPSFINRNEVLDGKSDCADGSDECPMPAAYDDDPLSSRHEMMKSGFFRAWVWIISAVAVCGNLVVVSTTLYRILEWQEEPLCHRLLKWIAGHEQNRNRHASQLSKCNDILVFNLAIADLLTGIYLLTIAFKSVSFSGFYCLHEMAWRSSSQCESLGVLVMTSILASVGIMVALSSYRLFAVCRPWKVQNLRITTSVVVALAVWLVAVFIGLLPSFAVLRDVFVTSVLVTADNGTKRSLYFSSKVVTKRAMTSFLRKSCVLMTYDQNNLTRVCEDINSDYVFWDDMISALKEIFPALDVSRYFGYYSGHGVCLPAIYPLYKDVELSDGSSQGTGFTVFLMTFIFIAFVYVALSYLTVCYRSIKSFEKTAKPSASHSTSQPSAEKRLNEMHKRIGRLVLTDFICWIPITVISFCGMLGANIPPWLYSFTVVVLLPINSAVNPVIYSDVIARLFKRFVKKIYKQDKAQPGSMSNIARGSTEVTTPFSAKPNRKSSLRTDQIDSSPRKWSVVLNQTNHNRSSFFDGVRSLCSTNKKKSKANHSSQESLSLTVRPAANNTCSTANTSLMTSV